MINIYLVRDQKSFLSSQHEHKKRNQNISVLYVNLI